MDFFKSGFKIDETLAKKLVENNYKKLFENKKEFEDINHYMHNRFEDEKKLIINGENSEVEKRHQRYLDYG